MRPPEGTHPCPVPGCHVTGLAADRLMCYAHWHDVPYRIKENVYREWNRGKPTANYLPTRQRAIDAAKTAERN